MLVSIVWCSDFRLSWLLGGRFMCVLLVSLIVMKLFGLVCMWLFLVSVVLFVSGVKVLLDVCLVVFCIVIMCVVSFFLCSCVIGSFSVMLGCRCFGVGMLLICWSSC